MEKLKSIAFQATGKSGEKFAFSSEVTVTDSTGEFNLTIPDDLAGTAYGVLRTHGHIYGVDVDKPRVHLRVSGGTLEGCRKFVQHVANDYLECEVVEEYVIV